MQRFVYVTITDWSVYRDDAPYTKYKYVCVCVCVCKCIIQLQIGF